ncbi:MAG: PQQ-binding-like beta-propeller repeat protein [Thermogutta sp.]|nr:PQQ-binding-like beta-propeller repeat protein [Thermogutta sp.]
MGFFGAASAEGQVVIPSVGPVYELTGKPRVDEIDSALRGRLRQVEEALAAGRYEDALPDFLRWIEGADDKLVPITRNMPGVSPRYVPLRQYGQVLLSRLPPEALREYRRSADGTFEVWYHQAAAEHDCEKLTRLVEWGAAGSWADDALWLLGEWAIQEGHPATARSRWLRLLPAPGGDTWWGVPDCSFEEPAVLARLVLASILEGDIPRAERELHEFASRFGTQSGRFGGRDAAYATVLEDLLREVRSRPLPPVSADWPTFAGDDARSKVLSQAFEIVRPKWRAGLPPPPPVSTINAWIQPVGMRCGTEPADAPRGYFASAVDDCVWVATPRQILAWDVQTGKPPWGLDGPVVVEFAEPGLAEGLPYNALGPARFSCTLAGGRLFARMGLPITVSPALTGGDVPENFLVCVDLAGQGRLLWKAAPPDRDWAFEGPPLVRDGDIYVLLRRSDIPSRVYLACYSADRGDARWQRFLCAADSPGRGLLYEMEHLLPTLQGDTLYVSTNLGCVAAVSASTGNIRWLTTYPRISRGDLSQNEVFRFRSPSPCLYHNGVLYLAPRDSRYVFALDAANGQILWQSAAELEGVVHLLGVVGNRLAASGDRLYLLETMGPNAGGVSLVWPDGKEPMGVGRGLIAGNRIYWPTEDAIYVFDVSAGRPMKVVSLEPWGLKGGNMAFCGNTLFLVGATEIAAFETEIVSEDTAEVPVAPNSSD